MKKIEEEVTKAFKFKIVENGYNFDLDKLIDEYTSSYNTISKWITERLREKIGDFLLPVLLKYKSDTLAYVKYVQDHKDMKLSEFIVSGSKLHVNNAVFYVIQHELDINTLSENCVGLGNTYFLQEGVLCSVLSNFRSSLSRLTIKNIKRKSISKDSTDEDKCTQCVFERVKENIQTTSAYKNKLSSLKSRHKERTELISRYEILMDFFESNKQMVEDMYVSMMDETLSEYDGCKRSINTRTISFTPSNIYKLIKSITPVQEFSGFEIGLSFGKDGNNSTVKVMGNRQITYFDSHGKRFDMLNMDSLCCVMSFSQERSGTYLILALKDVFSKDFKRPQKIVGIDVNIKHSLLHTSIIDDGHLKGYVNIYKRLLDDKVLYDMLSTNKQKLDVFSSPSPYVNFGLIEVDYLASRGDNNENKNKLIERRISYIVRELAKEYRANGDIHTAKYLEFTNRFRTHMYAYKNLREKYTSLYSEYSLAESNKEDNVDSIPFSNTDRGRDILRQMKSVESSILGCIDNIVLYAIRVIIMNGYDTIALEKLTSSTFNKRVVRFPSVPSILNYHKFAGKTMSEVSETDLYKKFHKYYNFKIENNVIVDASLTEEGIYTRNMCRFKSSIMKCVHFANVKDTFLKFANNKPINICLVPAFYTSQIDSIDHKLYEDASKIDVRPEQEKHINGLNADYNAARNIMYTIENDTWRDSLCKEYVPKRRGQSGYYSSPLFDSSIDFDNVVLSKIKKMGAVKQLNSKQHENF